MSGEENLLIGNNRAGAGPVGGIKKVVGVMVAQTAPTRLVRVQIFNNLFAYYYQIRYRQICVFDTFIPCRLG